MNEWEQAYGRLIEWLDREFDSARAKAHSDHLYAAERDKYRWLLQYMAEARATANALRPKRPPSPGDPF